MATLLTPNATYTVNCITVKEKIIPDGTVWKDAEKAKKAGFRQGDDYKSGKKLNGNGRPLWVTIHNTSDGPTKDDDAEVYTRSTYNENMSSARVHFYVDDLGAWQNLRAGTGMCPNDPIGSAEVGWHAKDGSDPNGGNQTSIAIEIIMHDPKDDGKPGVDTPYKNTRAYNNGARLAAWLLCENCLGIDKLVTHDYWGSRYYKTANENDPLDKKCVTPFPEKDCPGYILGDGNQEERLANWRKFKSTVESYLTCLKEKKNLSAKIYSLQMQTLSSQEEAATYAENLAQDGFTAEIRQADDGYRVYVGEFSKEEDAAAFCKLMNANGHTATATLKAGTIVS